MRRVWIGFGILVGLVLVLVVGGLIALRSIDWNAYKEPLATAVHDATGRSLDLSGDISLAIGLLPGIALHDVRFENAAWGSRSEMAMVDRLVVRMKLIPLVFGEIELVLLEIEGLDVLLETNAAGETNWTFESADPAEDVPPPSDDEAPGSGQLIREVGRVVVRDARFVIRDESADASQTIEIDRLQLDRARDEAADVALVARYDGQSIRLDGTVTRISSLIGGAPLEFDLVLEAGGAEASTDGRVDLGADPTGLDVRVRVEGEDLSDWSALAGAELPALGPYRLSLHATGTSDRIGIRGLDLALGRSTLVGEVDVALSGSRPRVDARLRSELIDLADLRDSNASPSSTASDAPADEETSAEQIPPPNDDGARVLPDDPLPIEALSSLDAKVVLAVERLETGSADVAKLDLGIDLEDRLLQVDPLSFESVGGSGALAFALDARRDQPRMTLKGDLDQVVLEELARIGGSELIQGGTTTLRLDLRGRGRSIAKIAGDLAGSFALEIGEAKVASQWAGLALADFRKILLRTDDASAGRINCVLAELDFEQGVGRPSALVADLRSVALFGSGHIDLGEEKLRLRFDRVGKEISASQALPPFEVRGTLADPSVRIDPLRTAQRVADVGVELLSGDALIARREWPEGCRNLLAAYEEEKAEPTEAQKITVESGKKAVDALKGLFGR